ncbi:MAG TPA: GNAT family N-acetyltransferase [Candidatus Paceibacterota bacterium]|nr:GNAT family N-acetyltransferase [Candidatus Paceibacterota bacterium]
MKIIKAKIKDAEEISKLRLNTIKNIVSKSYGKKWTNKLIEWNSVEHIKNHIKNRDTFCMVEKNKILGCIDLEGEKLGGLYIKYNLIGKGIGKKLLLFLEDYARKKKLKRLYLFSTKNALNFYKKFGYKLIEKKAVEIDGVKNIDLIMEKRL